MKMSHTDLKPENMLFVNSDCNVTYNPRMVCVLLFHFVIISFSFPPGYSEKWVEQGGWRPGEKGAGGVWEAGEEGAGSGITKVMGSERKRGKLCNIAQYWWEPTNIGQEPGLKGTGSRRFKSPCPSPQKSQMRPVLLKRINE